MKVAPRYKLLTLLTLLTLLKLRYKTKTLACMPIHIVLGRLERHWNELMQF